MVGEEEVEKLSWKRDGALAALGRMRSPRRVCEMSQVQLVLLQPTPRNVSPFEITF